MIDERYRRNIGAITEKEQEVLAQKKAMIVGCGGLGGTIFAQLLRIGVGEIAVVDPDRFSVSNLNRQLLCTEAVLGQKKADAAVQYGKAVNPNVKVVGIDDRFHLKNGVALSRGYDILIDGLDNVPGRKAMAYACKENKIPMIYGAIRGWYLQTAVFRPEIAQRAVELLYPKEELPEDMSCLPFVPQVCGGIEAAEAVKVLLKKKTELEDQILFGDLLNSDWETVPLLV